jgi:hypothetical protein
MFYMRASDKPNRALTSWAGRSLRARMLWLVPTGLDQQFGSDCFYYYNHGFLL